MDESRADCHRRSGSAAVAGLLAVILVTLLSGCATSHPQSSLDASTVNEVRFRDRAVSEADPDVRVTVAVPTAAEVRELFSADLVAAEIQPVWVKVENHSEKTHYLIATATDPNHFSPLEAAYAVSSRFDGGRRSALGTHFRSMGFRNPIEPDAAVSGFIFTHQDQGEKFVQVNLIAEERAKLFTFFVEIPDMRVDYRMVDFARIYAEDELVEVDESTLRSTLESLPCCTTDREGARSGDPINLVVIGDFPDVAAAFAGRGGFRPRRPTRAPSGRWSSRSSSAPATATATRR